MAAPPLLTLSGIALTFGGAPVFDGVSASVHDGDRIALVGRNGSGKSTLLALMAGALEADAGTRFVRPGVAIGVLEQAPDFSGFDSLGAFARHGVEPGEHHLVERGLAALGLDPGLAPGAASGGERRRAALARLAMTDAELLLIDEPTNHLDIDAILWLEAHLAQRGGAFVLISHDRAFLRRLSNRTLWVDRGQVRALDRGFEAFEAWRDKVYEEEDLDRHKRDRLIRAEARWAVEGISARRKRNMGRVRRLQEMRRERADARVRQGVAELNLASAEKSGRLVCDARGVEKSFDGRKVIRDFSFRMMRGDRVALVGPNGSGKTTLVAILTGAIAPDAGQVRLGTNLDVAVLDQNRAALNEDASLWETLTGDAALGVSGRNDQVMVRGQPRNVVSYLKDFLFTEAQAKGPVRALSGGEKGRLLLAKAMACTCNLLVLDEPTNDLDIETLDLLQEVISDFDGTVLLVSHDRDFVDRIAERTLAFRGDGIIEVHAGGYSDVLARHKEAAEPARPKPARRAKARATEPKPASRAAGLSFSEKHRLQALPGEIETVEGEVAKLQALLADGALFAEDPAKFRRASEALAARQAQLDAMESEWLDLAEREGESG